MRRFTCAAILVAALLATSSSLSAQASKPAAAAKAKATASNPVNLNSATVAQLQTLPGIGASTAQRIVDYRQKNGGYKKVEETLENTRSCPDSLSVLRFGVRHSVSRSGRKSQ